MGGAVIRLVRLLDEKEPAAITQFLLELDRQLLCYELGDQIRKHAKEVSLEITEVLWRARTGAADPKPGFWIGKTTSGAFVFLGRMGKRKSWTFVEDTRDAVLGSVPDDLLADAVARVEAKPIGK